MCSGPTFSHRRARTVWKSAPRPQHHPYPHLYRARAGTDHRNSAGSEALPSCSSRSLSRTGLRGEGAERGKGGGVKEKEHFSLKEQGAVILLPWSLRLGLLAFTLSDAQRALRGSCLKPENSKSWLSMSSFLPWEREEKESRNQTRAVTTVIFQRKART